jgi:hypothetical protein
MAEGQRIEVTASNPFVIRNPSMGMLNLMGDPGNLLLAQDRKDIGDLFGDNLVATTTSVPRCNVLFLYCALEPSGRIVGQTFFVRDVITAAGANIAVVASEIPHEVMMKAQYLSGKNDWPANIVVTAIRNGEHFGRFFHGLFSQMLAGVTMPFAWVNLAPQGPNQASDIPVMVCVMEAGHVVFARPAT